MAWISDALGLSAIARDVANIKRDLDYLFTLIIELEKKTVASFEDLKAAITRENGQVAAKLAEIKAALDAALADTQGKIDEAVAAALAEQSTKLQEAIDQVNAIIPDDSVEPSEDDIPTE